MPEPDRTRVHLVCGPTGAGKTTYAIELAQRLDAVRYSIDEWMTTLFWMDSPTPIHFAWTMERITRCEAQIWDNAQQVLARQIPVVLDLGFTTAVHRRKFIDLANAAGYGTKTHVADAPADERWQRVQRRNAAKGETYRLEVTREMFDFMESIWEAPKSEGEP
ncbi:MAG: ATP-binding protein [Alphaproteobacteria bacterium]|nr:ATP-binding protein [Alphaproteobacteria bacterium]